VLTVVKVYHDLARSKLRGPSWCATAADTAVRIFGEVSGAISMKGEEASLHWQTYLGVLGT